MPKRLQIEKHLSREELKARYLGCQDVAERIRWEVIYLLAGHTPSEYVANRTRLSVQWIRQLACRYNRQGPSALQDRRHQHAGPARLLSDAQWEKLKAALEQPVPAELGGGLWNGPKVAAWMSQQLGRRVHQRRGHVYLRLAGYTCQTPRPRHQKGDPLAQETFKNTDTNRSSGSKPRSNSAGVGF